MGDVEELIGRLRRAAIAFEHEYRDEWVSPEDELNEAADEIEALQARLAAVEAERNALRADALSAIKAQGLLVVPVEPTEAMVEAHYEAHARAATVFADPCEVWAAMLAAAGDAP